MAKNMLFEHLKSGLRNANGAPPSNSCVALGFTKVQVLTMNFRKPRLIWYKTFYDQGDSTKIKKSNWTKINSENFKKGNPISNLQYYIPMNDTMIAESNQPLE